MNIKIQSRKKAEKRRKQNKKKIKQIKLRKVKNRRARTRTLLAQEIYFLIFFSFFAFFSFFFHLILVVLLWGLLLFFACASCFSPSHSPCFILTPKTHSRLLGLLLVLRFFWRTWKMIFCVLGFVECCYDYNELKALR